MGALVLLAVLFIYGCISLGVIILVVKWAGRRERSRLLWGGVAALVMYHLLFWDMIPNYVLFNYFVKTRSGFWVHKTPEQWQKENPGVAETLTWREMSPAYKPPGYYTGSKLNERISYLLSRERTRPFRVWTSNETLQDIKTGEILVRRTKIYTDNDSLSGQFIRHSQKAIAKREYSIFWDKYKKLGTEVP